MSPLKVIAVAGVSLVLLYGLIYATGGTSTAYPHLMYLPIIFASFLGNMVTAVVSAVLAGLLLSEWLMPLSVAAGTVQPWNSWVFRLVMFAATAVWTRLLARNLEQRQAEELRRSQEIQDIQFSSLAALVDLAETRDPETTGAHMRRMQGYAQLLLEKLTFLGLTKQDRWRISSAVAFHDIGKVAIPDGILLKSGKLNEDEWDVMRSHPEVGARVIERVHRQIDRSHSNDDSVVRYLDTARDIVLYHHERVDGSGYPHGLKGNAIPLSAQVTAVCDVYDALRSERPYKRAYNHAEAVEYMLSQRGRQFSSQLMDAFLQAAPEFERVYERFAQEDD